MTKSKYERPNHNLARHSKRNACLAGTRVPVKNLFDYLKGGDTIDEFLEDFPSVKKEQILKLLSLAEHTFTFTDAGIYEETFA